MSFTTNALVLSLTFAGLAANVGAAPIFSTGAGSAVTIVDRKATFDGLDAIGIDLSAYSEDGLSISTPDTSFIGFDALGNGSTTGFFYGDDGSPSFVRTPVGNALERREDGWRLRPQPGHRGGRGLEGLVRV